MATRGSKKELSVRHENYVAQAYGGRRSKSSGAAITDEGDVLTVDTLFECKGRFGTLTGDKSVRSTLLSQFEKIADEAHSVGKEPALALRFYAPKSPLAAMDGYVDLVVRFLPDDVVQRVRHEQLEDLLLTIRDVMGDQ